MVAQNSNTARYISADEIANGARAFNDAAHTNNAARHPIPATFVGRTNNTIQSAKPTASVKRTALGADSESNTDQRPG